MTRPSDQNRSGDDLLFVLAVGFLATASGGTGSSETWRH